MVATAPAPAHARSPKVDTICPAWVIKGDLSPGLNDTEKRLICGDPKTDAWRTIPDNQARFSLKNFLQDRGHFSPSFTRENGVTWVDIGAQAHATAFTAEGAPPELHLERKRKVIGEVLTPALLSALEGWAQGQLTSQGYPCPEVKGEADPVTGQIRLHITAGPQQDLVSITEEGIPGMSGGMLRRYDAFRLGRPFNSRWLTVTGNRVTGDNLLENTHFTAKCGPLGATARQEVVPGPPRLLTAGFGLDSEGLVRAKLSWQNARLGPQGSRFQVAANGSSKLQRLFLSGDWYYKDEPARQLLRPYLELRHQNEDPYEYNQATTRFAHVWTWDGQDLGAEFSFGPVLDFIRTLRGVGAPDTHFLSLESRVTVTSHEYEYYRTDPVQGFTTGLTLDANDRSIFSSVSAQRVSWFGEGLWNVKQYDPALLIVALRSGARTVVTGETLSSIQLPATFLSFLGGSQDLRGFGRQELKYGDTGGLSSFFADLELRLSHELMIGPVDLQPLAFIDFGALGSLPWELDTPFFYSPGFGARANSPIGVFRATAARGYSGGVVPIHWQFYFSFGEEF